MDDVPEVALLEIAMLVQLVPAKTSRVLRSKKSFCSNEVRALLATALDIQANSSISIHSYRPFASNSMKRSTPMDVHSGETGWSQAMTICGHRERAFKVLEFFLIAVVGLLQV
jgi:hypothetical protein